MGKRIVSVQLMTTVSIAAGEGRNRDCAAANLGNGLVGKDLAKESVGARPPESKSSAILWPTGVLNFETFFWILPARWTSNCWKKSAILRDVRSVRPVAKIRCDDGLYLGILMRKSAQQLLTIGCSWPSNFRKVVSHGP